MALASRHDFCFVTLSLVCISIYFPVGHVFLGMGGAKAVRQCHQNDLVHKMCIFFVLYLTKLCSSLFLMKQSPARVIPRIIPDTYPESYPNLALLCHGPVRPFRKQRQSPAWCRREPFDIGHSLYVDSKEGRANHTSETYLGIIPRNHTSRAACFADTRVFGNSQYRSSPMSMRHG